LSSALITDWLSDKMDNQYKPIENNSYEPEHFEK
jgi:hypothetical protein